MTLQDIVDLAWGLPKGELIRPSKIQLASFSDVSLVAPKNIVDISRSIILRRTLASLTYRLKQNMDH